MSKLSEIFASSQEVKWLREENSFLRDQLRECREQLLGEIDSNRVREDELVNAVLEASEVRTRAGGRSTLLPSAEKSPAFAPAEGGFAQISDDWVEFRAKEFIDQSAIPYTDDMKILLKEAIRSNPTEYMT